MKTQKSCALVVPAIVCMLSLFGCASHRNSAHAKTEAEERKTEAVANNENRMAAPASTPVKEICAARCDRENRCNNIGDGKKYTNRDECASKIESDLAPDLNPYDCPKGYDKAQLDKCLNDIRNQNCGNPIEALTTSIACRAGAICLQ